PGCPYMGGCCPYTGRCPPPDSYHPPVSVPQIDGSEEQSGPAPEGTLWDMIQKYLEKASPKATPTKCGPATDNRPGHPNVDTMEARPSDLDNKAAFDHVPF